MIDQNGIWARLFVMSWLHQVATFIDRHNWLVTFIVGVFAIVLYLKQKQDKKRDSASLILQEIRYAEQKVRHYRTYGTYNFTEKLLPTNSWNRNINLFVNDLKETELDLISKFFSNAEYLDNVIETIARYNNENVIRPATPELVNAEAKVRIDSADIEPTAHKLIAAISQEIENIYNTPATSKLTKISEMSWYRLF